MPDKEMDGNSRIVFVEINHNTVDMVVDSVAKVEYVSGSQVEAFSGKLAGSEVQSYILACAC